MPFIYQKTARPKLAQHLLTPSGLIILILTLASCVTPPRVLLCHPKLSLICMLLTMKRQTAIRRATAGALGLDGSYGSHSQSASVSFGHKATMATMGHGHGGLSQVRTLAPIDFGATGENKHQQQQGQEQGQGQGQGHQQATLARSPRTPLVPRFGHPKDLSSFPSPSGTAGPGAFSRRKPPPTACSFESAMLQETEAPFVAYADAASASASAYTNPSNVNSVDTLPLEMRDKDHTGPMLESKQSPGFDRMTNGSIVSDVGEGGEDEKGQVGESQVALVHAH